MPEGTVPEQVDLTVPDTDPHDCGGGHCGHGRPGMLVTDLLSGRDGPHDPDTLPWGWWFD